MPFGKLTENYSGDSPLLNGQKENQHAASVNLQQHAEELRGGAKHAASVINNGEHNRASEKHANGRLAFAPISYITAGTDNHKPSAANGAESTREKMQIGGLSQRLTPYGQQLESAFKEQDLSKMLDERQKLHDLFDSRTLEGKERSDAKQLMRLADGAWEKLIALKILQANGKVDEKTFGAAGNDSREAFQARREYRMEARQLIFGLSLEQCADGALLEKCSDKFKEEAKVVRVWEANLEKDLLLHVGQAGWVSIDQSKVDSGILSILPHQRLDGLSRSGADILELDKQGERSVDSKFLQSRLYEATELVPGVYLRHVAFTGGKTELQGEAMLSLQGMILPENWQRMKDDTVRERFSALQKTERESLQQQLAALQEKDLPPSDLEVQKNSARKQWVKDFTQKTYEFVRDERSAGRLELTTNGEKAFRELYGMYSGSDAQRQQLNHWIDIVAVDSTTMAVSGGVANIVRAGAKVALERYIARSLGEEALKSGAARAGIYVASKTAEGYVFQASESGLSYLGGNKDAFQNFWGEGLSSTISFIGRQGSAKLVGNAIMNAAERTLSNETRVLMNAVLKGETKQAFLAQVIASNAKLCMLNKAGQLSAETLYYALQGQVKAVIKGQPVASLLSPKEWAEAIAKSAMQVVAMKAGRNFTKGIDEPLARVRRQLEDYGRATLPIVDKTSRTELSPDKTSQAKLEAPPPPVVKEPEPRREQNARAGNAIDDQRIGTLGLRLQPAYPGPADDSRTNARADDERRAREAARNEERRAARSELVGCLRQGWIRSVPELINKLTDDDLKSDEVREATSSGLVGCLSNGRLMDVQQIMDLKLLTEDEIRGAARLGLARCLSFADIDGAQQILGLKLLTEDDLKKQVIRDGARVGLAWRLSRVCIDDAQEILGLKLLTEDDLKDKGISSAARSGLIECLSQGWIEDAKQILDFKLLTENDLKNGEIGSAARSFLTRCLSDRRIEDAKQILDYKLLTEIDLQEKMIRDATNSWLAVCLSNGRIDDAKKVIDLKLLTEDDLKSDEIGKAARSRLAVCLSNEQIDDAKKVIDLKLLTEDDLKSDGIGKAARSRLAVCLSNGQIDDAKKVIDLKLLTEDDLKSDGIGKAARTRLAGCLSNGRIDDAKKVIDLKLLTEDDLKSDGIGKAARSGLAVCLSNGRIDDAKKVIDLKLLTEDGLKSDEIGKAARSRLAVCLSNERIDDAKKVIDLKLLTKDDIRDATRSGLAKCLSDGRLDDAKEVLGLTLLMDDDIRNAARSGLAGCLSKGWIDSAKQILDLKLLTEDDIKAKEIRKAARSGLARCLSDGRIDDAKQVLDFKLLTEDDIRDATGSGLAVCLSNGQIDDAKQVLDLKLLTEDDIKAKEIREAARSGLAKCLSDGRIDRAKQVLDFKLLTEDDIREATCSGLAKCLSDGRIDDAKQVLDLKLLAVDDLKVKEIVDATRNGLAGCLSDGWIDRAKQLLDLKLLDQSAIDECMRQSAQDGHITSVIRLALSNRIDLNTALQQYLGIAKLTNESATEFFADLKVKDTTWQDEENIWRPFEEGATIFGAARMLNYAFRANATPHDALFAFHDIVQLYQRSGLNTDQFYGNVLSQVNRDDAIDDTGSSFSRLNAIARDFPSNIDTVLQRAKGYPEIKTLQQLVASFPNEQSAFASWQNLQRFSKLQQFVEQAKLLPEIKELRQNKQEKLADWVEALAFHPDSKVSTKAVLGFWKDPKAFLDIDEVHAPDSHKLKKPSNYTDIPHLDLSAAQLRDALVNGTLDRLQTFSPMQVEYEISGSDVNLATELNRAIGSRREGRTGEAKNPGKLFSEVNKLLKPANLTLTQVLSGAELPATLKQQVETLLYNPQFGANRTYSGLHLVAEIHRKSDPLAVVAGDDTANCMAFGTGKNNVYMFNPNDALFTVRLVRSDGTSRTIAESVITKDKDVKVLVPTIMEKLQGSDKASLHTIFPPEALRGEKAIVAADNVEVHPNYQSGEYQAAYEAAYKDFFARYVQAHGKDENIREDKLVIGNDYSDAMLSLPKEPNTFVPQAPLGYSDKTHDKVLSLSLTEPQKIRVKVLKVTDVEVANRVKPQASIAPEISPLTFEDTLPLAYLEGKVFQDSPSLREGLHNMENALIAKDIKNTAEGRPNLSLKYADQDGKMKGYLLAYEGRETYNGAEEPVIFISDFSSDRATGPRGNPSPGVAGGKLLLEFGRLYKENYLDKGNLTPIFTNARDETSYKLLMGQMESLGRRLGYQFEVKEIDTHQAGSSTMHDVLIIPHQILPK